MLRAIVCIVMFAIRGYWLSDETSTKLGWIGAGRMGSVLAERLLRSGHDVAVHNRTRAKTEPLAALGATVVEAGMPRLVASGPRRSFETARPSLGVLGRSVTYVGEGDVARLVKIAHNLLLGAVVQCLAEITVLAERGGVARSDLLAFINDSVMGSAFTRYKTPAFVNLDFHPTFTGHLLRKDLELGLEAGRDLGVPLPITAAVHEIVTALVSDGHGDEAFAALLLLEAAGAGLELAPERVDVDDGLHPVDDLARAAGGDA